MPGKITAKDYYHILPQPPHSTGDIWTNLPTFGLLKEKHCRGIIITPACDLQNNKTATITFLPIISLDKWFFMSTFYPDIKDELIKLIQKNSLPNLMDALQARKIPTPSEIDDILQLLKEVASSAVLKKIEAALEHVKLFDNVAKSADLKRLQGFFGKEKWQTICSGIITNSRYSDTHYLPKDLQDPLYAAVEKPSVVLFRYPITIPVMVLNCAEDTYSDWGTLQHHASGSYEFIDKIEERPVRVARLKKDFLTDLLTRFLGLYIRMGSPDFSRDTVKSHISEIGA